MARKFMIMQGALHPQTDFDRVYLSREIGVKGLISCERCIRMEENNLRWYVYVWNSVELFIEGVKAAEIMRRNSNSVG